MANSVRTIQTAGLVRAPRGFQARPHQLALAPPAPKKLTGQLWPRGDKTPGWVT